MADQKITELTAIDAIVSADIFAVVDDVAGTPITKKATFTQLVTYLTTAFTDLTIYDAVNDANPQIRIGSADANEGHIQAVYDTGAQTLDYLLISTDSAGEGDIALMPSSGFVGIGKTAPNCQLDVEGAIAMKSATITTSSDAQDVAGIGILYCGTGDGTITLGGLAGGVNGQILSIFKTSTSNSLVLEDQEGTGTQKFVTQSGDLTLGAGYGGVIVMCKDDFWRIATF